MNNPIDSTTLGGESSDSTRNGSTNNRPLGSPIKIKVGSTTFTATLATNESITAFKKQLPLTLSMKDRSAGAVEWE